MDLWHETLLNVASAEHGKTRDANLEEALIANKGMFASVLELWNHLLTVTEEQEKGAFPNVMTRRQKNRAQQTLLRGFTNNSKSNFQVSNLFSFERRFSNCSKISSDSDTAEVEDILQRNQYIYLPPPMSNPLDYEFFVNVVRSEDEAAQTLEWQKLKSKLTASPVTPTIQLKDMNTDNSKEVDLQMYLAPDHMETMFAKLSPSQLSYLVISGKRFHLYLKSDWTESLQK